MGGNDFENSWSLGTLNRMLGKVKPAFNAAP